MERSSVISSSLLMPNSPARSCTRSLSKPTLLCGPRGARPHDRANSPCQITIRNANYCRLLPSYRVAERRRRRSRYHLDTPSAKQRHDLVQAVPCRVGRNHRQLQHATLRRLAHPIDARDCQTCAHPEAHQAEDPLGRRGLRHAGVPSGFSAPSVPPSSVVSSSISAMMRSASSGAMPGSRRRSSRSRSMMSFSVR